MFFGKKIHEINTIKSPANDIKNHSGRVITANNTMRKNFKNIFIETNI